MTRSDILESAAHIFSQKGYHAASMQDIADSVSLQKASLYHHFTSKQEILLALLDQALDLLIERIEPVILSPALPDEKFRQAVLCYLQALIENRDLAAILLLEHRSLQPDLRASHIPRRDRFEGLWRELIEQGADAGLFTCSDPALATRTLLGGLNWTITWYKQDGLLSVDAIAGQIAALFLDGLCRHT